MCEFIKPKKLTFEIIICLLSKVQIKPLLSENVERPENLHIDIIKYEFSKQYVLQVQHTKNENQNEEEVETDIVSDEEVAAEVGTTYDPPCSRLTYEADIQNAKNRILKRRNKMFIKGLLKIFCLYEFYFT